MAPPLQRTWASGFGLGGIGFMAASKHPCVQKLDPVTQAPLEALQSTPLEYVAPHGMISGDGGKVGDQAPDAYATDAKKLAVATVKPVISNPRLFDMTTLLRKPRILARFVRTHDPER